jgi:cytoskeletal protein CcmA (bactofilin family)
MTPTTDSKSTILRDVELNGSITFNGELVFDGKLSNGNIKGNILTLGPNAKIQGNVEAVSLTLHGAVTGDVLVTEKCELKGSAHLVGSLTTNRLVMDEGATLIGKAEITPDTRKRMVPPINGRPPEFPQNVAAQRR